MARNPSEEERAEEARRALRNVERDAETIGSSSFVRVANHLTAKDADPDDPAELWGKRVARGLSLVAFIVLAVWLVRYLMR
ncbi:MAG: hypothetical protein AAFP80_11270 [Pseudomonadota bacterium]